MNSAGHDAWWPSPRRVTSLGCSGGVLALQGPAAPRFGLSRGASASDQECTQSSLFCGLWRLIARFLGGYLTENNFWGVNTNFCWINNFEVSLFVLERG